MEVIIIVLLVGGAIYLFMKNKNDNQAKQPKKKVRKTRKSKPEVNDDK